MTESVKFPTAIATILSLLVGVVVAAIIFVLLKPCFIPRDFEAFGLQWHRWEGCPSVSPGKIRLVGPVDIQTHENYQSGNLTVTAKAEAWAPDTSIGFEIWAPDRYSIRVSRGRLIVETPEDSYEEAIPNWPVLRAGPITFQISWSDSQVILHIDGQPIVDYTGPEVPTRSLKVRLRAAEDDVLTVTQVEVG